LLVIAMPRPTALLLAALVGVIAAGGASAQEYRVGSALVAVGTDPLADRDLFGRNPLDGLGADNSALDRGPFGIASLLVSDAFSIAAFFASEAGAPRDLGAPSGLTSPSSQLDGQAHRLGIQAQYHATEQLSIDLSYGALREGNGGLTTPTAEAAAAGDRALTQSLGLGVSFAFNDRVSASVFYDQVRIASDSADGPLGGSSAWAGQKFGAYLSVSRIFTATDQVYLAALQPLNVLSGESGRLSVGRDLDGNLIYDNRLDPIDSRAVPLELSFSYMDVGAAIPRGLTFSLADDDARDSDGINVSAIATIKVPF